MTHTFEVIRKIHHKDIMNLQKIFSKNLLSNEIYNRNYIKLTASLKKFGRRCGETYRDDCNKIIIDLNNYNTQTKIVKMDVNCVGIKKISFLRICNIKYLNKEKTKVVLTCSFYLMLEINPRTLIDANDTYTIGLYKATDENNKELEEAFKTVMISFFKNNHAIYENMYDIKNWNTHRIDYAVNLSFASQNETDFFFRAVHETSSYKRTKKVTMKELDEYEQSAAERNKSYKFITYKKYDECVSRYDNSCSKQVDKLLKEAENVIRAEIQIKKDGLKRIKRKYNIKDRCIFSFLREDIAKDELLRLYDNSVGDGDFYNLKKAIMIIKENVDGRKNQEKLINFLLLIAEKKELSVAREAFVSRTSEIAHGTIKTFRTRLKNLKELNINSILIHSSEPLSFLKNPRDFIDDSF